ncbi:NAD-dependent protein deacylase sirtuin-5, mitochondrial [Salmonella phage KKP 3953]|nr:NAD-dependent protein deacylase sirtuin-5, mitochondrial [Salmonella phage KKP 3953]
MAFSSQKLPSENVSLIDLNKLNEEFQGVLMKHWETGYKDGVESCATMLEVIANTLVEEKVNKELAELLESIGQNFREQVNRIMRRLIVVSGAGLSVDSGVRAFRTDTASGKSLWDEYDLEEVCSLPNFEAGFRRFCGEDDPNYFSARFPGIDEDGNDLYLKTHEFYNMRRQELQTVEPNIAHLRIAEMVPALWCG